MGKIICATTIFLMTICFVAPGAAEETPSDAWVKGLWVKVEGLPGADEAEDMSDGDDSQPHFIYAFGDTGDGPAVSVTVTRYAQDNLSARIAKLDVSAIADLDGSQAFAEDAKDVTLVDAPAFSAKFSYPCQLASYADEPMSIQHTYLFIQTDAYMFAVGVHRSTPAYSDADVEKWLNNVEMVEQ